MTREALSEVVEEDIEYACPGGSPLLARVYRPKARSAPRPAAVPALVDVHGGAWAHFDRTVDQVFDRALAASGMVVLALDFRQGAAHPYPSAVADVVAGVRFARVTAAQLGIDPDRIGLIGGSSGGHLALLAAVRPLAAEYATTPIAAFSPRGSSGADRELDAASRAGGIRGAEPRAAVQPAEQIPATVAFVLALWPIADPLARYRYLAERERDPTPAHDSFFRPAALRAGHEGFFGDEATMERASVPRIVAEGEADRLPPIWVAHPELDENVTLPMSRNLVESYRRAGGHAELEVFPGVGHAFANFPGDASDCCVERMLRFIERQIGAWR